MRFLRILGKRHSVGDFKCESFFHLFITSGCQAAKIDSGPGFHCKKSSSPQNSLWNCIKNTALEISHYKASLPHPPALNVDLDKALRRIPHHILSGKWKKSSPKIFSRPLACLIDCDFNIYLTQFKCFSLKRLLLCFLSVLPEL